MTEERDIVDLLFRQAEIQSKLSNSLVQLTKTTDDMGETLKAINSAFSNGFRQEIKDHISSELRSPAFFAKMFTGFVIALGAIGSALVFIIK